MRSRRPSGLISAATAGSVVPSGSRAGGAPSCHTSDTSSGLSIGFRELVSTTTSHVTNEPVAVPVFVSETSTG